MRLFRFLAIVILCVVPTRLFSQPTPWRLAKAPDNFIFAMDLYRSNRGDTMYAMGTGCDDGCYADTSRFLRSLDGGETWDSISSLGAGSGALKVDPSSSRILYASHPGLGDGNEICVSVDGGVTWTCPHVNFGDPFVEIDPVDRRTIWKGLSNALWYSTDQGSSWQWTHDSVEGTISSLAIDPTNDSIMWATENYQVRKSTDRGTTFTPVMAISWLVNHVAIDPQHPNTVYVSSWDTLGGMWKTTDGGYSWNDDNGDLPIADRGTFCIAIDPRNPQTIFRGSISLTGAQIPRLFRSTDGGEHWSGFSVGMPSNGTGIEVILLDTARNKIFAGTGGYDSSGIYICDNCLSSPTGVWPEPAPIPHEFALYQNYPNQFNPITTIHYDLPKSVHVRLTISDVLGREVATLVNELQPSGSKSKQFNSTALPSGVYFYRIVAGDFVQTKKMVLMK